MSDLHLADDDVSDILYALYKLVVTSPIAPIILPNVPREAITGALFRGAKLAHEAQWGPGTSGGMKRLESSFHTDGCNCPTCQIP